MRCARRRRGRRRGAGRACATASRSVRAAQAVTPRPRRASRPSSAPSTAGAPAARSTAARSPRTTTGRPRPAARIGTPPHGSRSGPARARPPRCAAGRRAGGRTPGPRSSAVGASAAEADDLHAAGLALGGREALVAEHVEQAAAERPEQRAREAVDVHRGALGRREAVERGIEAQRGVHRGGRGMVSRHAAGRAATVPGREARDLERQLAQRPHAARARAPRASTRPTSRCCRRPRPSPTPSPRRAARGRLPRRDHSAGRWAGVAIARAARRSRTSAPGLPGEPRRDEARWIEADRRRSARRVGLRPQRPRDRHPDVREEARLPRRDAPSGIGRPRRARRATSTSARPTSTSTTRPPSPAPPTSARGARALRALLAAGTVDAFRPCTPTSVGFTWWDYRQGHFHRKLGLRIDLPWWPAARRRIAACGIDRNFRKGPKPSDHAPLLLELA